MDLYPQELYFRTDWANSGAIPSILLTPGRCYLGSLLSVSFNHWFSIVCLIYSERDPPSSGQFLVHTRVALPSLYSAGPLQSVHTTTKPKRALEYQQPWGNRDAPKGQVLLASIRQDSTAVPPAPSVPICQPSGPFFSISVTVCCLCMHAPLTQPKIRAPTETSRSSSTPPLVWETRKA